MTHGDVAGADLTGPLHEPLTIRRLLEEPPLATARVLAGAGGMNRELAWCLPWSEVAPGADGLDGVGVHVRVSTLADDPAAAALALRDLARRGAAAVLLAGDASALAGEVLAAAGDEDLPVVHLPATTGFPAVNRMVAERTLARDAHVLEYGVAVHRTLGELLYRGVGLPALGRQLSKLARCPAFILDPHGEVLVYEYLGTGVVPDPSEVVRLLREGVLAATRIPQGDEAAGVDVVELALEDGPVTCVVAPIVLGRIRYGCLVIVELEPVPSPHDLARHRVIAEQAVTIVGSEMLRLRSVEEAEERARGDFVHALVHGRLSDPHDLLARAAHHEFDVEGRYGVVVAHGLSATGSRESVSRMLTLARHAQRVLPQRGARTLATVVGDVLVVIRQVREDGGDGTRQVVEYARALARTLEERVGKAVSVTYGRPASGARGIPGSYREARIALGVCERLGVDKVSGYGELRVFAALADIAGSPRGAAFAEEVLAPLRHREGSRSDLEAAVVAYVETGGNLNAAARRLQMHRNTVLYKLDRASHLLGMDLRQSESRFTIWLAYRIDMLCEVRSAIDREFKPDG